MGGRRLAGGSCGRAVCFVCRGGGPGVAVLLGLLQLFLVDLGPGQKSDDALREEEAPGAHTSLRW